MYRTLKTKIDTNQKKKRNTDLFGETLDTVSVSKLISSNLLRQLEPRPLLIKNDFIGQNVKIQGFFEVVDCPTLTTLRNSCLIISLAASIR